METCDKNCRPIRVGDVLKVFHFTGARRKKHFMYKQVTGTELLGGHGGRPKVLYFFVSHLNLNPESDNGDDGYWLGLHEGRLEKYEIVQSVKCDHEDRERIKIDEPEHAAKRGHRESVV